MKKTILPIAQYLLFSIIITVASSVGADTCSDVITELETNISKLALSSTTDQQELIDFASSILTDNAGRCVEDDEKMGVSKSKANLQAAVLLTTVVQ